MSPFLSLTTNLKTAPLQELRKEAGGYLEFVIEIKNLSTIYPHLESFFGPPFKPAGIPPSSDASSKVERYGGIEKQQTLYYVEKDGISSCAMIWPWQDKTRATVKVAQGQIIK